jgi:hypothetical protein
VLLTVPLLLNLTAQKCVGMTMISLFINNDSIRPPGFCWNLSRQMKAVKKFRPVKPSVRPSPCWGWWSSHSPPSSVHLWMDQEQRTTCDVVGCEKMWGSTPSLLLFCYYSSRKRMRQVEVVQPGDHLWPGKSGVGWGCVQPRRSYHRVEKKDTWSNRGLGELH